MEESIRGISILISSLEELKKFVQDTSEEEAKSLLYFFFFRIKMLEDNEYPEEKFTNDLKKMYTDFLQYKIKQKKNEISEYGKKIHIVFGDSPAGSLKITLKELNLNEEEQVVSFSDTFSIGPISSLNEEAGIIDRSNWMVNHLNYEEDIDIYETFYKNEILKLKDIPSNIPIVIWTGDNAHEQTGLRFVLYLLKDKRNDIQIINATSCFKTQIPQSKNTESPICTGAIGYDNLKIIYTKNKTAAPITQEERKKLETEWEKLSQSKEVLRIWNNGHIQSVAEDYYDDYIMETVKKLHNKRGNNDFIKSARVIGDVIGHLNQDIGDMYLEYRLRQLIIDGALAIQGVPRAMRYYSVKLR